MKKDAEPKKEKTWDEKVADIKARIDKFMEGDEGRIERTDAGIDFRSISFGKQKIAISYSDYEGEKSFSCEEVPRTEFYIAMEAMAYFYAEELGAHLLTGDTHVIFTVNKVSLYRDKETGVVTGFTLSGTQQIQGWVQRQRYTSEKRISLTDRSVLILNRIFDEAYLYIKGKRAQQKLFDEEES